MYSVQQNLDSITAVFKPQTGLNSIIKNVL